jgi:hypothetical protein
MLKYGVMVGNSVTTDRLLESLAARHHPQGGIVFADPRQAEEPPPEKDFLHELRDVVLYSTTPAR